MLRQENNANIPWEDITRKGGLTLLHIQFEEVSIKCFLSERNNYAAPSVLQVLTWSPRGALTSCL